MTNVPKYSIMSRVHHLRPTWVVQPSQGKAILDQAILEEPLPYTCHPSTDQMSLKTPYILDWWVTSPANRLQMPAKSLYKCSKLWIKSVIRLFYANIASVYLVLPINSVHGHSNCIVSGLDLTMHTCSLMDLCIIGALLNAFAHGVIGSDDFYSWFLWLCSCISFYVLTFVFYCSIVGDF